MDQEADASDIQSQVLQNTLAEIATRTVNESDHPTTEICCVICLDSIAEPCEAKPCQHRNFHFLCLCSWLEHQTKCPLCKSAVNEVHYDFGHQGPNSWAVYTVPRLKPDARSRAQSNNPTHRPESLNRASQRRRREDAPPPRRPTEDEAILRRQDVYRNQLYSLHVGSNPRSGYRDISPTIIEAEPHMVSRARSWLRRELQVFEFLRTQNPTQVSGDTMTRRRASNAEFLLEYIIAILKTVDIQGSQGQAQELLKDFLGRENARLLLHELNNFLRSPWSIETWDRHVQYPPARKRRIESGQDGSGHRRNARRRRRATTDSYRPAYSEHRDRHADSRNLRRHGQSIN
ncbi:hypothetical protein F5X96DRAFT_451622 [Biscogniauxia mediterranea]|nr:hypothetical protein F5X96DRAFT_451622 [Biscogniauxia mediterranea]